MDKLTTAQNIEQQRSQEAYNCAKHAKENLNTTKKVDKAYKSYVKKTPMLIKTNGLGATFSYILSKKKEDESKKGYAYQLIYEQITKWVHERKDLFASFGENQDLIEFILSLDSAEYRSLTNEIITFFTWLRRFAEGLIEGEDEGDDM